MKTIKQFTQILLVILFTTFGANEKVHAHIITVSSSWTSPGPSMCGGEKFELSRIGMFSQVDTVLTLKELVIKVVDGLGVLDSIFLYEDNGQKKLIQAISATKNNFNFSYTLQPYAGVNFIIIIKPKINKKGTFEFGTTNYTYMIDSRTVNTSLVSNTPGEVIDCSPKFKLQASNSRSLDGIYCQNERPSMYANFTYFYGVEFEKFEWFVNDTLVKKETDMQGQQPWISIGEKDKSKLTYPRTRVKLKVTDKLGRVGYDSLILNVLKVPSLKMAASSMEMCRNKGVTVSMDTKEFSKWSWDWSNPTKKEKTELYFSTPGAHSFSGIADNGCLIDTSFFIYELPSPLKPEISIDTKNETLVVSDDADSIVWYKFNDKIPNAWSSIKNSDTMFLKDPGEGYYIVKVFNKYGCYDSSKVTPYGGPTPDLRAVDIIIEDTLINEKVCAGQGFHPRLSFIILESKEVRKIEWFIGTQSVHKCENIGVCKSYPLTLTTSSLGITTLTVVVTLSNDKFKMDMVSLTVVSVKKPMLVYSTIPRYCLDSKIDFTIKQPELYSSIYWPNQDKSGSVLQVKGPKGYYFAKVTDVNGCVSYSDTSVELSSIELPKPDLAVSNCKLFANINYWTQDGIWEWSSPGKTNSTTLQPEFTLATSNAWWKVRFMYAGCYSEFSNSEFVDCNSASVNNLETGNVKVYPNPFISNITIDAEPGSQIVFTDIQGKIVHQVILESNTEQFTLDFLPAAFYIVTIKKGDTISRFKLLKQ